MMVTLPRMRVFLCLIIALSSLLFGPGVLMADALNGRENLAAFYAALVRARLDGTPVKIHIVGDSKVAGNGVSTPYRLDQLLQEAAQGYPVQVTFDAWPGQNSYTWASKAAEFVASHSDASLLIVDIGTNERVTASIGGLQTIEQTKANHLAAIATVRASLPPSSLSILLLGQTPGNNWQPEFQQTTAVMQEVNDVLKDVAATTNSAYFDTLDLFQRAHGEASWMEQLPTPDFGGGNVHPGEPMNLVFVGELARKLFPLPLRAANGQSQQDIIAPPSWAASGTGPLAPIVNRNGGQVMAAGTITFSMRSLAFGTTLCTIPVGYRPRSFEASIVTLTDSNGHYYTVPVQVLSTGIVQLLQAVPNVNGLMLGGLQFVSL